MGEVAQFDEDSHEPGLALRVAAHPQRRRLGGRERAPVHRLQAVPGVLVGGAVACAVAGVALRPDVEGLHGFTAVRTDSNQGWRTRTNPASSIAARAPRSLVTKTPPLASERCARRSRAPLGRSLKPRSTEPSGTGMPTSSESTRRRFDGGNRPPTMRFAGSTA